MPKSFAIPIFSFFCMVTVSAQSWQPTPTHPQGNCSDLQYWQNQLLVSTYEGLLFSSTNEGQSWQSLPLPGNQGPIYGLYQSRNHWFAGCAGGMYASTNQGQTWRWINIPTTYVVTGVAVLGSGHLVVTTADVVGGGPTASGIIRSTNQGTSWESVSANLPGNALRCLLQTHNDQLIVAIDQPGSTAGLFTTWLGPSGSFSWQEMPIRLFHQGDSSLAAFKATDWFDLQLMNDTTLLVSAAGVVQEAGAPNAIFVQWIGKRRNNPLQPSINDPWVETIPFGPQYNQWWDQPAPANILRLQEKNHWYGSLQGGNARGGAWVLSDTIQGWQKRNNGIPAGPNGWEVMQFAEGPFGRVFAIHQGFPGVYFNDFSRTWATSVEEKSPHSLRIWPNPGNGLLRFEPQAVPSEINVYSSVGQLMYHALLPEGQEPELNIGHLQPGTYFLTLKQKDQLLQARYLLRP